MNSHWRGWSRLGLLAVAIFALMALSPSWAQAGGPGVASEFGSLTGPHTAGQDADQAGESAAAANPGTSNFNAAYPGQHASNWNNFSRRDMERGFSGSNLGDWDGDH